MSKLSGEAKTRSAQLSRRALIANKTKGTMKMAKKSVYVEQVRAREEKGRKKWPLVIAGVAVLAVAGGIGSTFAANITLNSGNEVEFAQGTQVVSACDSSITTALTSKVVSGVFYVNTIKIEDLDTTECADANLVVRVANASNALQEFSADVDYISIDISEVVGASGVPVTSTQGSAEWTDSTIIITPSADIAASSVDKVLIETN